MQINLLPWREAQDEQTLLLFVFNMSPFDIKWNKKRIENKEISRFVSFLHYFNHIWQVWNSEEKKGHFSLFHLFYDIEKILFHKIIRD